MNSLGLMLLFLTQAAIPAPLPGMPAASGVYYRQDETHYTKIAPISMADMKTKGLEPFLETSGLTNLSMTYTYDGAQAPLQITAPRPTFCVRGTGPAQDVMIVQLTRGKDNRTIQTSSAAVTVDNKGGFKKKEIQVATVTVYSDGSFSVTPDESLKPGEYLLIFGHPDTGFEFGISPRKK